MRLHYDITSCSYNIGWILDKVQSHILRWQAFTSSLDMRGLYATVNF